jgi:hypothetical protein
MSEVTHRGTEETAESYRGIPAHAAPGVHEKAVELLASRLPPGSRVADLGAGQGALSLRLSDAGFEVISFELDRAGWKPQEIECIGLDLNHSVASIAEHGPFDAFCAMDVIEHLENPRGFIRQLIAAANGRRFTLVMSLPNPLDTFSTIALFRRGVFNWFSPAHYTGGGHISVIPYWLLDEHLRFLGLGKRDWYFLAPYVHDNMVKRLLYRSAGAIRRLMSISPETRYFEGQAALVVATYEGAAATHDGELAAV